MSERKINSLNGEAHNMEEALNSLKTLDLRDVDLANNKNTSDPTDSDSSCTYIGHKIDVKKEKLDSDNSPAGWLIQNVKNKTKKLSLATKNITGNAVKLNHYSDPAVSYVNGDSPTSYQSSQAYSKPKNKYNFCNKTAITNNEVIPYENSRKLQKKSDYYGQGLVDGHRRSRWKYRPDVEKRSWRISPATINKWLKTIIEIFIAAIFLASVGFFVFHLQQDFKIRLGEIDARNKIIMKECENSYFSNKCSTNLVPYMVGQCEEWEACMKGLHFNTQSSLQYVKLIAEVLNSFFTTLEFRTVCLLVFLIFALILSGALCAFSK